MGAYFCFSDLMNANLIANLFDDVVTSVVTTKYGVVVVVAASVMGSWVAHFSSLVWNWNTHKFSWLYNHSFVVYHWLLYRWKYRKIRSVPHKVSQQKFERRNPISYALNTSLICMSSCLSIHMQHDLFTPVNTKKE